MVSDLLSTSERMTVICIMNDIATSQFTFKVSFNIATLLILADSLQQLLFGEALYFEIMGATTLRGTLQIMSLFLRQEKFKGGNKSLEFLAT
jgi:hypothetical protein